MIPIKKRKSEMISGGGVASNDAGSGIKQRKLN